MKQKAALIMAAIIFAMSIQITSFFAYAATAEYAAFPLKTLKLSQDYRGDSHKVGYKLDFVSESKDVKLKAYAPFTGAVKKLGDGSNGVYFESSEPVYYAGSSKPSYITLYLCHSNNVNLKKGQTIKKGELLYEEGTFMNNKAGAGAVGSHIHMEVGLGQNCQWIDGHISNPLEPCKVFYVDKSFTTIIKSKSSDIVDFTWTSLPVTKASDTIRIDVSSKILNAAYLGSKEYLDSIKKLPPLQLNAFANPGKAVKGTKITISKRDGTGEQNFKFEKYNDCYRIKSQSNRQSFC
jgi:murein DD-endopeptidase MepM/ murein hydrolase activator NlpD